MNQNFDVVTVVSPKSCAFPVVAMVIKSIVFTLGWSIIDHPKIPLMHLILLQHGILDYVKSPKSVAFPVVII